MTAIVFSRRDVESFTPEGSPRTYQLAPLTFRERQAFRAEMARIAGAFPGQDAMLAGLRAAVHDAAPDNLGELLMAIDDAEATPEDATCQARLAAIEAAVGTLPVYANLVAARRRYIGLLPWAAARFALRGWEGEGLPSFRRVQGAVPEELLEAVPHDEIEAIGARADQLMRLGPSAEGNSAGLSPSPESPTPSPEG